MECACYDKLKGCPQKRVINAAFAEQKATMFCSSLQGYEFLDGPVFGGSFTTRRGSFTTRRGSFTTRRVSEGPNAIPRSPACCFSEVVIG